MNGDDVFEREQDQIEVDRLRREIAKLTEDVGKCHDIIGEDRASDTSELWKFFETQKQIIYRLRCREDEIAAERALADRLALIMEDIRHFYGIAECAKQPVTEALAAWKEARRGP